MLAFSVQLVHRSEVIKARSEPEWKPFEITVRHLCKEDKNRFAFVKLFYYRLSLSALGKPLSVCLDSHPHQCCPFSRFLSNKLRVFQKWVDLYPIVVLFKHSSRIETCVLKFPTAYFGVRWNMFFFLPPSAFWGINEELIQFWGSPECEGKKRSA